MTSATHPDRDIIHVPVLKNEVLAALSPKDGGRFVDGTFGDGGYSRALLQAADCTVYAIDRDPDAIRRGAHLSAEADRRLILLEGCFSQMDRLVWDAGAPDVDGVALDIGVSSHQLEDAGRGFSFLIDGPLDMRMSRHGETAADVVNRRPESVLVEILRRYGEEPKARRIASAIVSARQEAPITRTVRLAELVAKAVGFHRGRGARAIHPATKTFQALRIYVNNEAEELRSGLEAAERLLSADGRLCVVSFHSLEDRIVKSFLAERSGSLPTPSRHRPPNPARSAPPPTFRLPRRSVVKPTKREVDENPRSRSARLRVAVRTAQPPWPCDQGNADVHAGSAGHEAAGRL